MSFDAQLTYKLQSNVVDLKAFFKKCKYFISDRFDDFNETSWLKHVGNITDSDLLLFVSESTLRGKRY